MKRFSRIVTTATTHNNTFSPSLNVRYLSTNKGFGRSGGAFKKREKAFEEKEMRKHNQNLLEKLKEKLRLEKIWPKNKDTKKKD